MVLLGRASHGRNPSAAPRWFSGKICTANAFWVPSGSAIAETPMYEPGLISDIEVLATPNTATLSVMRTFMSLPSRDFTVSKEPSTASMVPRIRTGGGCWAQAVDPSTDMTVSEASTRGNNEYFGMVFSSQDLFRQRAEHRNPEPIPCAPASPSHRRRQPV